MENQQLDLLPIELQIKILKYLDFDSLFSIKRTSHHFLNLINNFDIFAYKEFGQLSIYPGEDDFPLKSVEFDLDVSTQLLHKWQLSIDKEIPLYLYSKEIPYSYYVSNNELVICVSSEPGNIEFDETPRPMFAVKLSICPKSIDDFKLIRFWLLKFARCSFTYIDFRRVLNPEMIKLIFDQNEIKKFKLFGEEVEFVYQNKNWFNIIFDYLVIKDVYLYVTYEENEFGIVNVDEANYFVILLNILLNKGDRIQKIMLEYYNDSISTTLFDRLLEHIETSKNCSNVINHILFNVWWTNLNTRGIEKKNYTKNDTKKKLYEITSMHNSNIKFSMLLDFRVIPNPDAIISIEIKRLDVLTLNKQNKKTSALTDKTETIPSCSYASTTTTGSSDPSSSSTTTNLATEIDNLLSLLGNLDGTNY